MLTKTEAIVLKTMKYRDTSKIVTFYTKNYGKIKGLAKGARSAKNKFGAALEPMSYSMLVLYKKEHQDLHLISQCDTINPFRNLAEDLSRMAIAMAVLELVNQVVHNEERNEGLFNLLAETLSALDSSTKNYKTYLQAFRLRLVNLFGFSPNLDFCGECGEALIIGNEEKTFSFQIARGAVFCSRCIPGADAQKSSTNRNIMVTSFSAPALQVARRLAGAQLSTLGNLECDFHIGNEIDELLRLYLRYHFDGLKPLKSIELFHQHKMNTV